jgi:hypothetical protein
LSFHTQIQPTDTELALLDSWCRREIHASRHRLEVAGAVPEAVSELLWTLLTRIVEESETAGPARPPDGLNAELRGLGARADYAEFTRNSRNHQKAEVDCSKPHSLWGIEFADAFVRVQNHIILGCCNACWAEAKPYALILLETVRAELPEKLTGVPPRWKCHPKKHCKQCGWLGHEGQMGKARTLMGDSWFYAKCPSCSAENKLFNTPIETVKGFEVVPTAS